jgi:hypothetical protein
LSDLPATASGVDRAAFGKEELTMANDGILDSILEQSFYNVIGAAETWNVNQVNGLIRGPVGWKWEDVDRGPLTITYSFFGDNGTGTLWFDPSEYLTGSEVYGNVTAFTPNQP